MLHNLISNYKLTGLQCESKTYPPNTYCNIFTQTKCISVTCCGVVARLYPHKYTNHGRFIVIFNKMALIFSERELMFMFAKLICRLSVVCLSVVCL